MVLIFEKSQTLKALFIVKNLVQHSNQKNKNNDTIIKYCLQIFLQIVRGRNQAVVLEPSLDFPKVYDQMLFQASSTLQNSNSGKKIAFIFVDNATTNRKLLFEILNEGIDCWAT